MVLPPQVTRAARVPGAENCPGTGHRAVFTLLVRRLTIEATYDLRSYDTPARRITLVPVADARRMPCIVY